ncbi:hypothetical protein B0H11DRAFT_1971176 [Mycena galericulata]|nr:hypothetical protein B0H11DRAFT_1971176 [Mycena galericulata]
MVPNVTAMLAGMAVQILISIWQVAARASCTAVCVFWARRCFASGLSGESDLRQVVILVQSLSQTCTSWSSKRSGCPLCLC